MKLAPRLSSIKPSPTLALNAKAKALVARGEDVISFAAGEPDFDTPDHVKKAVIEALEGGFTRYTATAGIPELRQAVVAKLKRDNALDYTPEQILVSTGAKHSLFNAFQALVGEGDEVIIFSPYWVSYPDMVLLAGGTPIILETREVDGYAPNPEALKRALTPRTKAVVINSPSNPTGAVLTEAALRGIADAVAGHDCAIVSDEIYEKLLYSGTPYRNILNVAPGLKERTLVVNGFSKAHAMTGLRLGYAAGPRELIAGMQKIQDQSTSNATSIIQCAGVAALNGPSEPLQKMVAEFKARRDLFVAGLNSIEGFRCRMPEGAFYVFPQVREILRRSYKGSEIKTSVRLSEILLDDFRVAAMPGQSFGAEDYLRLSFATSRSAIQSGLERLRDFASQLG